MKQVFSLIFFFSSFMLFARGPLDNAQFNLNTKVAIWGQQNVPVTFSINNLSDDSKIESFAFSLKYNYKFLLLQKINLSFPQTSSLLLTDCTVLEKLTILKFEVHNTRPLSKAECKDLITFNFWPTYYESNWEDYSEDNIPEDTIGLLGKHLLYVPISLKSHHDSWITDSSGQSNYDVFNRKSGGILLYLCNGAALGSGNCKKGATIQIPLDLIIQTPFRFFNIGLDYDEDMVELQTITPTVEGELFLKSLTWNKNSNRFDVSLVLDEDSLKGQAMRLSVATIQFLVKDDVPTGTTIDIGKNFSDVRVNGAESVLFTTGEIIAEEYSKGEFVRGDANLDGILNTSDAVTILEYLTSGNDSNNCLDASDINDDGKITISDVICLLSYFFNLDKQPQSPFPYEGLDPTEDFLPPCTPEK